MEDARGRHDRARAPRRSRRGHARDPRLLEDLGASGTKRRFRPPSAPSKPLAARNGWKIFRTENAAVFNDAQLSLFDVVFGNNITGDNWSEEQKQAFIRWSEGGGGFVGVHGAAGTRFRYWDWYTDVLLGGGRFTGHPMRPQFRKATVLVDDPAHPIMRHFGASFEHVDEWYSFEASPREVGSHVLARLDEATYDRAKISRWATTTRSSG